MGCSDLQGIAERKREIRRRTLAARAALGPDCRARASAVICRSLLALPEFAAAATVMGFSPMAEEVDIEPFLADTLRAGKRLLLPRADPGRRRIAACEVRDLKRDRFPGHFGILEPTAACPAADPGRIDLIAVPAAAVGKDLRRLGYGGGFYDRFLVAAPQALKVAVVFSVQRVDSVPAEAHDAMVDRLLCEADSA